MFVYAQAWSTRCAVRSSGFSFGDCDHDRASANQRSPSILNTVRKKSRVGNGGEKGEKARRKAGGGQAPFLFSFSPVSGATSVIGFGRIPQNLPAKPIVP